LSLLATNSWNGSVTGMTQLQQQYQQQYGNTGTDGYIPNVFVQYWSMRVMAYLAVIVFLFALWGAFLAWRHKLEHSKWFLRVAIWVVFLPFFMTTAGWILTENGRQPWIVQGLMLTKNGVSSSVSATDIWISLSVLVAVFITLLVIEVRLMFKYGRRDLEAEEEAPPPDSSAGGPHEERVPVLTY